MNPIRSRATAESGFTVIEALIAMAILAVASVTLIGVSEAQVGRIDGLETRAVALWAGENALAELSLSRAPPPQEPVTTTMLDRTFEIDFAASGTDDPELAAVTVSVREAGTQGPTSVLTGFLDMAGRSP